MDEDGTVKQMASAAYTIDSPRPGWAERDPAAWWVATKDAVGSLDAAYLNAVQAMGVAGQMHGVVLAGEDGRAMPPAVLWADERTRHEGDRYRELDPRLMHRLVNPPATGMAGGTFLWLKTHESAVHENARLAPQTQDWLRVH